MPEKTKTGKWIFPIRDAAIMKKDGWFIRDTNTKGVSVRLARLKSNDTVVVQSYIFDTKKGWDQNKAEKWLKDQDIKWIATLQENEDTFKGECYKIVMVINNDVLNDSENIIKEDIVMSEQKEIASVQDGDARERIIVETDSGIPTEIVKVPKRIVTHRSRKKGSNGKPLNLNGKDYGKSNQSSMNNTEITKELDKCGTSSEDEDKNKKWVRSPKKK